MPRSMRVAAGATSGPTSVLRPSGLNPIISPVNASKERFRRALARWRRKQSMEDYDSFPATSLTDPFAFKALKKGLLVRLRKHQEDLDGRKGARNQQAFVAIKDLHDQVNDINSLMDGLNELKRLYRTSGRRVLAKANERLLQEQRHTVESEVLGLNMREPRKLLRIRKARVQSIQKSIDWCERCFG